MTHTEYEKMKSANKKQFKDSCVSSFKQELQEVQTLHPHVLDFYYADHYGCWTLRSTNDDFDMEDFDTKDELLASLTAH